MGKRLDWDAHKFRKRARPLITDGERRDNKLKAQQLAERIRRGRRTPNRFGAARQLSPDEITAWAEKNLYSVADTVKSRTAIQSGLQPDE